MMVDFVCENNSNKLGDTGKNQISMQSLLILGSASCKTEIVFDVVDIPYRYVFLIEKEKQVCHFQIFHGNLKKYLPKKAVYMVS